LVLTALLTLSGALLLLYFYRRYWSTGRPLAQQGAPASGRPQLAGRSRLRNPSLMQQPSRSAFRKRDRLSYWLRRVMRQAAPNLPTMPRLPQGAELMQLLRPGQRYQQQQQQQLRQRQSLMDGIPDYFLEPTDADDDSAWPPPMLNEFYLAVRSLRIFDGLEKSFLLEMCKCLEIVQLRHGETLFDLGDADGDLYIVQRGRVRLLLLEQQQQQQFHEFGEHHSICSLLSFLEVLTGSSPKLKSLRAVVASSECRVLRIPAGRLAELLAKPQHRLTMVRLVQLIVIRLQRVTFQALNGYLGLTSELVSSDSHAPSGCRVLSLASSAAAATGVPPGSSTPAPQPVPMASKPPPVLTPTPSAAIPIRVFRRSRSKSPSATAASADSAGSDSGLADRGDPTDFDAAEETAMRRRRNDRRWTSKHHRRTASASSTNLDRTEGRPGVIFTSEDSEDSDSELDGNGKGGAGASSGDRSLLAMGEAPRIVGSGGGGVGHHQHRLRHQQQQQQRAGRDGTPVTFQRLRKQRRPRQDQDGPEDSEAARQEQLLSAAQADLAELFGLSDASLLDGRVSLANVHAGAKLAKQGEHLPTLFYVVTGRLAVTQQGYQGSSLLYSAGPGELCGMIAILTGEASLFTVRCEADACVAAISSRDFYALMRAQPSLVLPLASLIVRRLSPFLRQVDFVLDWLCLESGKPLYKQGDIANAVYLLLHGRLRQAHTTPQGHKELTAELGRGDLVGFLEVFTTRPRATTVLAVRDSELAAIPVDLLDNIKRRHPYIVTRLTTLVSQWLLGNIVDNPESRTGREFELYRLPMSNLRSVALFPASTKVPLEAFSLELQHAMSTIGASLRLNSRIMLKRFGRRAFDRDQEYRVTSWLAQQEDDHRLLLYLCDLDKTAWTKRCIRQADCVLIVALASDRVETMDHVRQVVLPDSCRVLNMLILLHKESTLYPTPGKTGEFLSRASEPLGDNRLVIQQHLHVRAPRRMFSRRRGAGAGASSSRLLEVYRRVFAEPPDPMSDISRLARVVTNTAVGLVLGGGGARGIAHVGIVRALTEHGIPIDMVGGTSIGSFMGALWAEETRLEGFEARARQFSKEMSSLWNKLVDLTYPQTAMFTGRAFNRGIESVFGDRCIEDLWLPYFCITTDITKSQMRVHTSGSLWRYVRASMSLSGYLPPLCDPASGNLLLDGGYVNNLPADVMKTKFAPSTIFAVDVGSQDETNLTNYGDELSGWWLLYKRINPFAAKVNVPNLTEIQSRLAYVSCVRQLERVKSDGLCEYLRPPIERYATLQFGSFEEIYQVGYRYALDAITKWSRSKKLPVFKRQISRQQSDPLASSTNPNAAATAAAAAAAAVAATAPEEQAPPSLRFTDLAEMLCRIDNPAGGGGGGSGGRGARLALNDSDGEAR
ncbi:hypothetical protein BOX15_Mlig019176g2, partial [Macrostomum lignano]